MSLKNLNWKKVTGKEAIKQGSWDVRTSDGELQSIWLGINMSLASSVLTVKVNGKEIRKKRLWKSVGQLVEFDVGGDHFSVQLGLLGMASRLVLLHNGQDIEAIEAAPVHTQPPEMSDQPEPMQADNWETWIDETERYSEPLGDEERVIDNSRSNSSIERRITASRQWVQSISLDTEKATELQAGLEVKLPLSLGLTASATQTIKRTYSVSEEITRTYSDEVTITIPEKTRTRVVFRWRQIWQRGVVVGKGSDGTQVRIPFEVKLHPTFDQSQEDCETP